MNASAASRVPAMNRLMPSGASRIVPRRPSSLQRAVTSGRHCSFASSDDEVAARLTMVMMVRRENGRTAARVRSRGVDSKTVLSRKPRRAAPCRLASRATCGRAHRPNGQRGFWAACAAGRLQIAPMSDPASSIFAFTPNSRLPTASCALTTSSRRRPRRSGRARAHRSRQRIRPRSFLPGSPRQGHQADRRLRRLDRHPDDRDKPSRLLLLVRTRSAT